MNRKVQGFTLVEVMIALSVVSVAVYMLSSTITATMVHSTARKERTLSVETAMNVLEHMREGKITSRLETGIDEHAGTHRLTFWHQGVRVRFTCDSTGEVLKTSRVDTSSVL